MTREEIVNSKAYQVSKAALEYYNKHHQDNDIGLYDAFEAGAEWADENSNSNGKELLYVAQKSAERAKKEVISKACEWLEENLFDYPWYDNEAPNFSVNDVINDFKKAMEL